MKRFYISLAWFGVIFALVPAKELRAQEHLVAAFNVGGGCLMSGLAHDQSFLKGCLHGTLGGALVFSGMKMVATEPNLGPVAHLTNSLGVSIWENQIAGRGPFEEYRAFVGPLDLRFNFKSGRLQPRLLVGPMLAIGRSVVTGERFLARESFRTGTIIFELKEFERGADGIHWAQGSHGTIAINPLEIFKDRGGYFDAPTTRDVLRHELVHSLQYRRFALASSLAEARKVEDRFRFFSFTQDISWFMTVFTTKMLLPPEYVPTEMEAYAFLPQSHFDFWR